MYIFLGLDKFKRRQDGLFTFNRLFHYMKLFNSLYPISSDYKFRFFAMINT